MQKIEDISEKNIKFDTEDIILYLKNSNKSIPTKYLYDDTGSKLFEQICNTEEYYLTRTEKQILNKYSSEISKISNFEEVFELGSGSSKKTKILILEGLKKLTKLTYSSLDISEKALEMSSRQLKNISPFLRVKLFKGDFINDIIKLKPNKKPKLYLFLGSTLGNFNNQLAVKFLNNVSNIMQKNDYFLLGVDKIKNHKIITSAYNDKKGITKKFNKNILRVINKKFKLNFDKNNFDHFAEFNKKKSQIEMYLEAVTDHKIYFPNQETIKINNGDKILTEISRKFSDNTLEALFKKSELKVIRNFSDNKKYFSLYLLKSMKYS